jgi:hypothetical protein
VFDAGVGVWKLVVFLGLLFFLCFSFNIVFRTGTAEDVRVSDWIEGRFLEASAW